MELAMKIEFFYVRYLILAILSIGTNQGFSQIKKVNIKKIECKNEITKNIGNKLFITVECTDKVIITPVYYYNLDALINLSDSTKIAIIGQLLRFKNDTSICCLNVNGYYNDGIERTCTVKPKSKRYTIQIDALYMINKIVHPNATSLYSCFPVIINRESKMEINECPDQVIEYYKIYESWYDKVVKSNKIGEIFPFNTEKYAWFGAGGNIIR